MRRPVDFVSSLLPEELESEDYFLLAAVILLPWAFGGVEIWAYRSASLLIAVAAAVSLVKHGPAGLGLDRRSRWLTPALLLAVWGAFQLVPMPPGVVRLLSPETDAIYAQTFPGYGGAPPADMASAIRERAVAAAPAFHEIALPEREDEKRLTNDVAGRWTGWRGLSLLPGAGVERLAWYFTLLLGFLLTRRRCADPDVSRIYRAALFGLFMALAVFGLIYAATTNNKLYWVRETIDLARPFGPYVNPTNFAAVMEMAVAWLAGYALFNLRVTRGMPLSGLRSPVVMAASLLCVMAALATASKSSALLICASLLLLLLLSAHGMKQRLAVLAGSAATIALAVPLLGNTRLGTRYQQFMDMTGGQLGEVGRMVGWTAATGMARDFPVTGIGFGAFRDVFPRYMPPGESARWAQLHNDYYELLIEGGAIAIVLLLWLGWGFWSRSLRRRALTDEGRINPEAVGLVLGLLAMTVHAGFDFNHQIQANALLFVTLAAMAVVRGESTSERERTATVHGTRRLRVVAAVLLVAFFGLRAAVGWWAGPGYSSGLKHAGNGRYEEALPLLVRGSAGEKESATLWLRGQVRVGLWQDGLARGDDPDSLFHLLDDAHREYTRAISMSPASGWYWLSLGELYHQVERLARYRDGIDLDAFRSDPRTRVGESGRVAIGLTRFAITKEPTVYTFHDQLAFILWDYQLRNAALEAVRGSAQVQPVYRFHAYENLAPVPAEIIDAFTDASREALGHTPFLRRTLHLLALGRMEYRRGNLEQAEQDLRAALDAPGELLNRAEGQFYLGLVLIGQGRLEEAEEALLPAEAHPNFEAAAVAARAGVAEAEGREEDALGLLRRARQLKPRNIGYLLEFARIAQEIQEWKKAEEALRWGTTVDREDPRPWRRLVGLYLEARRLPLAREALDELRRIEGESGAVQRYTARLEQASD